MSSVQSLRDFISQRLAAAAAEIFVEFEKTIEEELDRHCRLLETSWRPQTNTNTTDVPQEHVCEDEEDKVLADLHLCYEKNSSQDQNQPEPPQFKEEQEELFSSHQEEQFVLDQDTETSVLLQNTSRCEEKLEVIPQDFNQNQEEISVHHRLLDVSWNPEIRLHRIDLPQQQVCKEEEVLSDQQLWNQERNSSLDQEEPELPQMKEEQEEVCSSQEGEQLVLKQETDTLMMTPTDQERDLIEAEPITERTNQEQSKNVDSGSTTDVEMNPKKKHHRNRTDDKSVDHSHGSQSQLGTESGEKTFKCDDCGKVFRRKCDMLCHYRIHTGEKPFKCETCGKAFTQKGSLVQHSRIHTDEKPYFCEICEKYFRVKYSLILHMRIHTNKIYFECKTCGKAFTQKGSLVQHSRIHTGEKPYSCKICGKCFRKNNHLINHIRIHTGEKPFKCETCGKAFRDKSYLLRHSRIHTDEKPFKCETCGKAFRDRSYLPRHSRIHAGQHFQVENIS